MSSKRPHVVSGGGGGTIRRRLRSSASSATVNDGLACARCSEAIPYQDTHAELRPCRCPVCLKCLVNAHALRGSSLLTCCDGVVASHVFIGAERIPEGKAVKNNTKGSSEIEETAISLSQVESLPEGALSHIASYLTKTTRALFAVALTAPSLSWERSGWNKAMSDASKVVMAGPYYGPCGGNGYESRFWYSSWRRRSSYSGRNYRVTESWQVLNFFDVEQNVRTRLTDGDVGGVLVCIDAVSNLKTLRLPHCINVRGDGLVPLHGSLALERVDLSLASIKYEGRFLQNPALREEAVVPFLESIRAKAGNSLMKIHLPDFWCNHPSYGQLYRFVRANFGWSSYNLDNLRTSTVGCRECHSSFCDDYLQPVQLDISQEISGAFQHCPECDMEYCEYHREDDWAIRKCDFCEKEKCVACADNTPCDGCEKMLCQAEDCMDAHWCENGCSDTLCCEECILSGDTIMKRCRSCGKNLCERCTEFRYSVQLQGHVCADCI